VGAVLRASLSAAHAHLRLGARPLRVLRQLAACGTYQLGAHVVRCEHCQQVHYPPRSCGDRHCPRCLAGKSRRWLQAQLDALLPVRYYHCVFTLPPALHALVQLNPARLYPLLFAAAAQALLELGRNTLGGDLGLTIVLHTWGQTLNFHPHLHCIVTSGALSRDGARWRGCKQRKFLFPVRALAALFRGKFLAGLKPLLADEQNPLRLPDDLAGDVRARARWRSALHQQRWHLYLKPPFGGPEQVLAYLANYTHRVALSNRRLVRFDRERQTVTFTYRDYRDGAQVKPMTLSAVEFIRRFSWHILPAGLVRIRHYGLLGNNRRHRDIPKARALLQRTPAAPAAPPTSTSPASVAPDPAPVPAPASAATPPASLATTPPGPVSATEPGRCPYCGGTALRWIGFIDARGRAHFPVAARLDSS
jgi:hypothetical protein